jgi:hypothetical protein
MAFASDHSGYWRGASVARRLRLSLGEFRPSLLSLSAFTTSTRNLYEGYKMI